MRADRTLQVGFRQEGRQDPAGGFQAGGQTGPCRWVLGRRADRTLQVGFRQEGRQDPAGGV